jgi:pyruvate/2-oxoglutarate dehydrogenase complex dihydrolipoamide dehydrogenase (E3) component
MILYFLYYVRYFLALQEMPWFHGKSNAGFLIFIREEMMNETKTYPDKAGETNVDVVVLGVGTSGEDLSLQLLDAGLKVVGIESALVGGECAYWACLPSKMMIRASNVLQEAHRSDELAGHAEVKPDWNPVARRVREATGGWDDSFAVERFEKRGGRLVHGRGKLTGPRTVSVGDESFTARLGVVIATGSKPAIPPIQGIEQVDYWTTHEIIQLERLPKSLIVLGGGTVGCELGQVLARFGVQISIVEAAERLLPAEEPEVGEVVEAAFADEGIAVYTDEMADQIRSRNGLISLTLTGGKELTGERLLLATGRRVDLSGLGLESVGLDGKADFIPVDERMHATDGVWALGDVTGKGMFTHVALHQAAIIAAEILGKDHTPATYDAVPRTTFTDPEVASVGMRESDARAAGHDVVIAEKQLSGTFRGWLHAADKGLIKLVVNRESGILVGATVVGPQAGEMIGILTLAIHARVALEDLRSMIYAFPTFYGGIGEALGAYGRGVTTVLDPGYQDLKFLDEAGVAVKDK